MPRDGWEDNKDWTGRYSSSYREFTAVDACLETTENPDWSDPIWFPNSNAGPYDIVDCNESKREYIYINNQDRRGKPPQLRSKINGIRWGLTQPPALTAPVQPGEESEALMCESKQYRCLVYRSLRKRVSWAWPAGRLCGRGYGCGAIADHPISEITYTEKFDNVGGCKRSFYNGQRWVDNPSVIEATIPCALVSGGSTPVTLPPVTPPGTPPSTPPVTPPPVNPAVTPPSNPVIPPPGNTGGSDPDPEPAEETEQVTAQKSERVTNSWEYVE